MENKIIIVSEEIPDSFVDIDFDGCSAEDIFDKVSLWDSIYPGYSNIRIEMQGDYEGTWYELWGDQIGRASCRERV